MTTKARQLAEFIANADVDSDEIATGAVSASKLAATLDLSSKTIVLPDLNQTLTIDRASSNGTPIVDLYTNKSQGEFSKLRFYNQAYSSIPMATISAQAPTANVYGRLDFQVNNGGVNETIMSLYEDKVGIGTTDPNATLVVSTNGAQGIEFFPTAASGVATTQYYNRSGAAYIRNRNIALDHTFNISGATDDAVTIASTGNVGIGTGNPQAALDVRGSILQYLDNGGISFNKTSSVSSTNKDYYGAILRVDNNGYHYTTTQGGFGSAANDLAFMHHGNLAFATTSATGDNSTNYPTGRMIILENGNIGIGTRSPGQKFNVLHNVSGDWVSVIENTHTSNGYGLKVKAGDNNAVEAFRVANIANDALFSVKSGGNVGIGTSSPFSKLQVNSHTFSGGNGMYQDSRVGISNHGELTGLMLASTYNDTTWPEYGLVFVQGPTTSNYNVWSISPEGPALGDSLHFIYGSNATNIHTGSKKVTFDGNGNVGIGTETPDETKLEIGKSGSDTVGDGHIGFSGTGNPLWAIRYGAFDFDFRIDRSYSGWQSAPAMSIRRSNGNVGIGLDTASAPLHVYRSSGTESLRVEGGGGGTGCKIIFKTQDNGDLSKYIMQSAYWTEIGVHNNEGLRMRNSSGNIKFQVSGSAGNCTISGSLSKGSGSFKIDHPLDSLSDTHHLVHSFIEGPQADLIYRGKVQLVDGQANVNIDTASNMTVGTFEVLCRDVQCFTSNETGWTAVKGSVTGNILSIIAQDNTCTDTISWMVVGERKDPHMYDTEWTDSDGKIIVEPLKVTEEDQLAQSIAYHEG